MFRRRSFFTGAALLISALFISALVFTGCPGPNDPETLTAPDTPTISYVLFGDQSLTVVWNAMADATGYDVYFDSEDGGVPPPAPTSSTPGIIANVSIAETTATITGLTNGTKYHVWVRAKNSAGASAYSASSSAIPMEPVAMSVQDGYYKGRALPPYEDGYEISNGTITYYDDAEKSVGFAGQVVYNEDDVIIIQITNGGSWYKPVGKYYGLYCGDITDFSFTGSSAYKDGGENDGIDTLEAAITAYTNTSGYFGYKAGYGIYAGESTAVGVDTSLTVSWTAVPGATNYEIYYHDSTFPTSSTTGITSNVTITGTTATITGLTNDTEYHVWVRPTKTGVTGAWVYRSSATPTEITVPANLIGYHQSKLTSYSYNFSADGFEIDNDTKTYYLYDDSTLSVSFAGTIVKVIPDNDTDGRIIIKITDAGSWYKTENNYYAVAYKNLSGFSVQQSSAYLASSSNNDGFPTLAEAINEYTVENEYFGYYGDYYFHTASANTLGDLKGTWYYEDMDYYVVINGTSYIEFMDGEEYDGVYDTSTDEDDMLGLKGDIVDHTSTSNTSGILYIKSLGSDIGFTNEKYIAVAWADWDDDTITFMTASDEYETLEAAKMAKNDPSDTAQFTSDGFFEYENNSF